MAYTIVRTDGTVLTTIPDGIVNTTSTPLSLPGRLYPGYGQVVDTNFVRSLENFASTTPPLNALKGQLWFNTNDDSLYICPIDGETDPNNWYQVISYPLSNLELTDLNASGDITANNAYIDNDVTANHIITDYLTVNVNADIEEATISGVAYIGEANTTSITTGTRPTLGNMIGTWTVNGLGTVNGVSNTSLWVTGGNLVVTGPGTVGIRTNNYMWANGVPVSFDGTYTNTNVMFYLSTFEGNLSFPGSNTAFNGNIISTGSNSNSGTIIGNWTLGPGSTLNGLPAIDGANVTGIVGNAQQAQFANNSNRANTVIDNYQPNITSVGTLTGLNVNGDVTAKNFVANTGMFSGNGFGLYNIPVANIVGTFPTVGNATNASQADVANTVRLGSQPNITSVGTLSSLSVSGGASFNGTVNLGSVNNVRISGGGSGQVLTTNGSGGLSWTDSGSANTAQYVTQPNQSNITSVGTLSSLSVSGGVSAGSLDVSGSVSASSLSGTLTTGSQPSITSVGTLTGLTVSGSAVFDSPLVTLGSVSNIRITGGSAGYVLATDGAGGLSWVPSGSATTAQYVTQPNQPNITSTGTLIGLAVAGVTNLGSVSNVKIAGGSVGQVLTTNGAGDLSWTSAAAATTAQTVTNNAQPNITSTGTLTGLSVAGSASFQGITNLGSVGNVRISGGQAGYVLTTNGSGGLSWTSAGSASTAEYVTQPNQSNITSLGTLSALTVQGPVNLGAAANLVITGGSSGQVLTTNGSGGISWSTAPASTTAQTVTNNAQPNITSVGTLNSLSVSGITNLGNLGNVRISGGSEGYVLSTNGSGLLTWIPSGTATTAVTVTGNAQPNITSLGTLSSLSVSGTSNLGTAANVKIMGGASGQFLTTNGSGGLSWSGVPAANTVTNNAQPNITSVGTLSLLNVAGTITGTDITITGRYSGSGAGLTNIPGANVTGVVNGANYAASAGNATNAQFATGADYANRSGTSNFASAAGTANNATNANYALSAGSASTAGSVTNSSQPSITSLGTLTGLAVNGPLTKNGQPVLSVGDFIQSFGTNGYTKLPNGFIMQWGQVPYGSGEGSSYVTFPISFPSGCLSLTATIVNSTYDNENDFWYQIIYLSSSGATLYRNSSDGDGRSVYGYYIAIGY